MKKKWQHATWGVFLVLMILLGVILSGFQVQDMTLANGKVGELNQNWTLIRPDGSREEIASLPFKEKSRRGEVYAIETLLPTEFLGRTISFLSADVEVRVLMDGKEIYSFGKKDKRLFGHTPGSVTNFVDLPEDTAGELRIEFVSPYDNYASDINPIRIGKRDVLILSLMKQNLGNFGCSVLLLACGLILFLLTFFQIISKQETQKRINLAVFFILFSVSYAIETKILSAFYGNQTVYSNIVFFNLMLAPLLVIPYYSTQAKKVFQKIFDVLYVTSLVNVLVQLVFQLLNLVDFMDMVIVSHVLIFLTIFVIMGSQIANMQHGQASFEKKIEVISIFCMLNGSLLDMANVYISLTGDFARFGRWGTTIYGVTMAVLEIRYFGKGYADSLVQNEKLVRQGVEERNKILMQLADYDIMTGVKNRNAYERRVAQIDAAKKKDGCFCSVLDINGLKKINDSYGHASGDEAIKALGLALIHSVGQVGEIYRTGGDEFVCLTPHPMEKYIDNILECLFQSSQKFPFQVVAAWGCEEYKPGKEESIEGTLSRADAAMYRNKELTEGTGRRGHRS